MNAPYGSYGAYGTDWWNPVDAGNAVRDWWTGEDAEPRDGDDYRLDMVIPDADTGLMEDLPTPHSGHKGSKVAPGTPTKGQMRKAWLKNNWMYLAAGAVILGAGVTIAALPAQGGRRRNPRMSTGDLLLRLAGMGVGTVLVVTPEPISTVTGLGLIAYSAGTTLRDLGGPA